jgi:acyl-coenzyme A synthetase/AMP-(fatty) acid ligase
LVSRTHGQLQSAAASQVVETLPLNPSGKVMKFVLRDQLAAS